MANPGFEFHPEDNGTFTVEAAVFQALGAASSCWTNLSGAGEFQSERAQVVGDKLVEFIIEITNN